MRIGANPVDEGTQTRTAGAGVLLGATVFLSALLLFQVQPMIGKYILPWFGSTPGVWATALLFFQLMLLCGYAYAHFTVSRLTWRRQAVVHVVLLGLALITLPITPAESLKPTGADAPALRILLILTTSVGAPYLLLSATAPLIQRWFAGLYPGRSPYRLYALSNLGSLLALLSYPFLVEPYLRLGTQTSSWSVAYVAFAALCAASAWVMYRSHPHGGQPPAGTDGEADQESDLPRRPDAGAALLWVLLSACGSGLLLATTNQMSTDIAVVPFLWILPLSVYLLTFILTFDHERWYLRPLFVALLPLALINAVRLLHGGIHLGIVDQVVGYTSTLFVCCMCCHGELSRARPAPRHLTFFFLMVSVGGAVGGLLVALVAPALLPGVYEYHFLLVACYVLVGFVLARLFMDGGLAPAGGRVGQMLTGLCWAAGLASIAVGTVVLLRPATWMEGASENARQAFAAWQVYMSVYGGITAVFVLASVEMWRRMDRMSFRVWWTSRLGLSRVGLAVAAAMGLVSLTGGLVWQVANEQRRTVELARNFYGALALEERDVGDRTHQVSLTHGRIRHGSQLMLFPTWPVTYYGPETGVGLAIRHHPNRSDSTGQFRIGVVGLGTGTLAAYVNARVDPELPEASYVTVRRAGVPDYIAFYELNPLVTRWARDRFTYLLDAEARGAEVEVFPGDARLVLDGQLDEGEAQRFDVLALDAFSSDAIPLHLLTQESVSTYLAHLREGGILAVHVTNRYVDLVPIVGRLAATNGLRAVFVSTGGSSERVLDGADWVLLTRNQAFLDLEVVHADEEPMGTPGPLWTDDFSSLFRSIKVN